MNYRTLKHWLKATCLVSACVSTCQISYAQNSIEAVKGYVGDEPKLSRYYAHEDETITVTYQHREPVDGKGQPVDDFITVKLRCEGAPGNSKTLDGFTGGWEVESVEGSCLGEDIQYTTPDNKIAYDMTVEAQSRCVEREYDDPDYKKYCTWSGKNGDNSLITGNTGDDMFRIEPYDKGNGTFFEFVSAAPKINDRYRLRWIKRNNVEKASEPLMLPAGPWLSNASKAGAYQDFKRFIDQNQGGQNTLITTELGCFPVKVNLCINKRPEANDDTLTTREEVALTANVLTNDTDPNEDDTLTLHAVTTQPKNGLLSWNANGQITYTPDNNFAGTDSFIYEAVDSRGAASQATATIIVTDVAETSAKDDVMATKMNVPITINVLANDFNPDPNHYKLKVHAITQSPENGTLNWNADGTATYTPNTNFSGSDSFIYQTYDGYGTYTTARAEILVKAPVIARDDIYTVVEMDASYFDDIDDRLDNIDTVDRFKGKTFLQMSGGATVYEDTGTDEYGFKFKLPVLNNDSGESLTITSIQDISFQGVMCLEFDAEKEKCVKTSPHQTWKKLPRNHTIEISSDKKFLIYQAGQDGEFGKDDVITLTYTAQSGTTSDQDTAQVTIKVVDLNSPLVFDLDGDGIDVLNGDQSNAHFDLDLDGNAERTGGWIGGGDAFLSLDLDGNGKIDDKNELFGDTGGHAHGFASLASYDSNNDGIIDMGDDIFANLTLWQDLDGDGVTDEGELSTLMDHGISSINLGAAFVNEFINDQWESHRSTFTYDDGTEGQVSDIWFRGRD